MKVVAFDWDGTLCDSRSRHSVLLSNILKKYGYSIDTSDLIIFKSMGKSNIQFLEKKGVPSDKIQKIQKEWICHIEDPQYLQLDSLYDDTYVLLDSYSQYKRILITARSNKKALLQQVHGFGLTSYFSDIFIVNPGSSSFMEKAEILKQQNAILMIGDTLADKKSAELAGISFHFHEKGFHDKRLLGGLHG